MGGHGGLNILPQKRWNVYNFDNREKVRKDEEAAAKEEQLKREQSRKRDTEFRIEQLRQAHRGLPHPPSSSSAAAPAPSSPEPESKSKLNHINLFEGIRIFDPVEARKKEVEERGRAIKKMKLEKVKEEVRVMLPEDEKYKLGYGVAGKGVKLPWYLSRPQPSDNAKDVEGEEEEEEDGKGSAGKSSGRKTVEEMREERLRREKREKERERALVVGKGRRDGGFSRRDFLRVHGLVRYVGRQRLHECSRAC